MILKAVNKVVFEPLVIEVICKHLSDVRFPVVHEVQDCLEVRVRDAAEVQHRVLTRRRDPAAAHASKDGAEEVGTSREHKSVGWGGRQFQMKPSKYIINQCNFMCNMLL